jgi:N-acetylglucosamine kinase-like BadF-type ATPase
LKCLLVRDCGGTSCRVLTVKDDGTILGAGRCDLKDPKSGRDPYGSGRSIETVRLASDRALNGLKCDELLIVNGSSNIEEYPHVSDRVSYQLVKESDATFALADQSAGVIVLSGTGSFVHGRARDGRIVDLDGAGHFLGDFGSGYHIGYMAVRAALRAGWHERHRTSLEVLIYRALGAMDGTTPNLRKLIRYSVSNPDRAEIAALAMLVDAEANAGDRIAREILQEAAEAIGETLYDVVDRLGIKDEEYPLIGIGGVVVGSKLYWEYLCDIARSFAPKLKPMVLTEPPVLGVALAALASISDQDQAAVRERLFASAREHGILKSK